jgi:hypothetical protein
MVFNSLTLIVLMVFSPIALLSAAATAGACFAARNFKIKRGAPNSYFQVSTARFALESTLLAVVPMAILAFGQIFWLDWESSPRYSNEKELLRMLTVLCLIQVGPVSWFVWRHCVRSAATMRVAVLTVFWTLSAQATSAMAITGKWL